MKDICKCFVLAIFACVIILTPRPAGAEGSQNIDVVLVIDSSGSMQKTDPLSLRVPAAKLFISLLDSGDRAGIISFSDRGDLLSDLLSVDSEENKEKLFSAADRISSDGLYTNLYEAFHSGYTAHSLHDETGREKIVIVLSDGIMDVGNLAQDRLLLDTLTGPLTENFRKESIRVYTIAFTQGSDRKLLEQISKRTGGFYNTALTDKEFHGVFTSIFESLKSPEMVPMSENSFVIDSAIEEVTIVATKSEPETEIQIISPAGDGYSSTGKYSGIGWFVSENFDMITILKPLEGKWEILFSTGENNKAYVITDLKLQTDFDQMYAIFGEHMDVRIWLEKEGAKIKEDAVLDTMKVFVELTGPDGNSSKLQAFYKGDGIFLRTVAPFTPGTHKMKLIAEGMTFKRAKSLAFNVANLEESKKDLIEQREEKKRQTEADAARGSGEEHGEDVSFIALFAQFIAMNAVIGLIVLGYARRDRIREFVKSRNVADLLNYAKGLTILLRRKQAGGVDVTDAEGPADAASEPSAAQVSGVAADSATENQVEEEDSPSAADSASPSAENAEEEASSGESAQEQELKPIETAESLPQPESSGETPPEQEAEEMHAAESGTAPEETAEENAEDAPKEKIDLEEIEMEEKGKQEEALEEDRQQMMKSLQDSDEDDLLDAVTQAVEMLNEKTGQQGEPASGEPDDIQLTQKARPDQSDETPQDAGPGESTPPGDEPVSAEPDDIELTPKEVRDPSGQTAQEAAVTPDAETQFETSADNDVFDSVIAEMEEAMKQEQEAAEKGDAADPESSRSADGAAGGEEEITGA